ncbi:MAG TPA: S8 family serine peptidase [Flavitalea sp.]|nr:S8 family serine peptidase [Flavitalea sp.]
MNQIRRHGLNVRLIFLFTLVAISTLVKAQGKISDYVIYAGFQLNGQTTPPSPGVGVVLGNNVNLLGGAVGSNTLVYASGTSAFGGSIYSNGKINLVGSTVVNGRITAKNGLSQPNPVVNIGSGSSIHDLDFYGNAVVGTPGTVAGTVTHPATNSLYTGPKPSVAETKATPYTPALPPVPEIKSFTIPNGLKSITTSTELQPNKSYGVLALKGGQTVTFKGAGDYFFSEIKNGGSFNKFIFDPGPGVAKQIRIFVKGDAVMNKMTIEKVNGASNATIYLEVQGKGTANGGFSFLLSPGSSGGGRYSEWYGTVWAPFAGIKVGSGSEIARVGGALISSTQVLMNNGTIMDYAPFIEPCVAPTVNAGADKSADCPATSVQLQGSSQTSNVSYQWSTVQGHFVSPANASQVQVDVSGTYYLTVTNNATGCTAIDSAVATITSCILPDYPPDASGKVNTPIGSYLTSLAINYGNVEDSAKNLFVLVPDSVMIEVISIKGKTSQLKDTLIKYGMRDFLDNEPGSLIITGRFPIAKLFSLNLLTQLLVEVHPLFPPVKGVGAVTSGGDTTMQTNLLKAGYGLSGNGIKIGVLSDSYNKLGGAALDVLQGDLPPDVKVVKDYPYAGGSDEGRAMSQILFDVAPGASLLFRTGFLSAGDFGNGIRALADSGANIIVEDISYIGEPFFQDGQVARAANSVFNRGIPFFSAAGNSGDKSYSATFTPGAAVPTVVGQPHYFGPNDPFQKLTLDKGSYTIVLQWQDSMYSNGQTTTGTRNDLDMYLTYDNGKTLFGFNHNNTGNDPIEVLSFNVREPSTTNIMIVKASGPDNPLIKYVIFRGEAVIEEYQSGTSTIVGQANAAGAFAVGAVRYNRTPAYGVTSPVIETFSSYGGTLVNGQNRNKPDFVAPQGSVTTVDLNITFAGAVDNSKYFFGTSAAAPHAAALAALLLEGRKKYYNDTYTPTQLKSVLQSTAYTMYGSKTSPLSGAGLVQGVRAVASFVAPKPEVTEVVIPDTTINTSTDSLPIIIKGSFLTDNSILIIGRDSIATQYINDQQVNVVIPPFIGNPDVVMYNPPLSTSGNDGGLSIPIKLYSKPKQIVIITPQARTKRYGEKLPAFAGDVLVDSIPLAQAGLTLKQLGIDTLYYETTATSLSDVGVYIIKPVIVLLDSAYNELFTYQKNTNQLFNEKLPLTITPMDTAITYGDPVPKFRYKYDYPDALISPADKAAFLNNLNQDYTTPISSGFVFVDGKVFVRGRQLTDQDLTNLAFLVSGKVFVRGKVYVRGTSPSLNDTIVEASPELVYQYQLSPDTADLINGKVFVRGEAYVQGKVYVRGTPLVQGKVYVRGTSLLDSAAAPGVGDEVLILDETDITDDENVPPPDFTPINLVTGITAGLHKSVPAAFLSGNFNLKYALGNFTINKALLTLTIKDSIVTYGKLPPAIRYQLSGFKRDDSIGNVVKNLPVFKFRNSVTGVYAQPGALIPGGTYIVELDSMPFIDPASYSLKVVTGTLKVNGINLLVNADEKIIYEGQTPVYTSTITGFIGNDSATQILSGPTYSVAGFNGKAGVYVIKPSALNLKSPGSYIITYDTALLYVNPKGNGAKKIKPALVCIQPVTNHPSGMPYVAHFSVTNDNRTVVKIPIGPNNSITPEGYIGRQPEIFEPGTEYFDIFFDGNKITYTVVSYDVSQQAASASTASSTSSRCPNNFVPATVNKSEAFETAPEIPIARIYPNPVRNKVVIQAAGSYRASDIKVTDMLGKNYPVRVSEFNAGKSFQLDLTGLKPGRYVVLVNGAKGTELFNLIKL